MLSFKHRGNFKNTERFFKRANKLEYLRVLEKYGKEGVRALASSTPVGTGKTANSWDYKISQYSDGSKITWVNSNVVNGVPIAILLQYGHGTRNGGYVQGRDFINPAMQPIFDKLAKEIWREVTT